MFLVPALVILAHNNALRQAPRLLLRTVLRAAHPRASLVEDKARLGMEGAALLYVQRELARMLAVMTVIAFVVLLPRAHHERGGFKRGRGSALSRGSNDPPLAVPSVVGRTSGDRRPALLPAHRTGSAASRLLEPAPNRNRRVRASPRQLHPSALAPDCGTHRFPRTAKALLRGCGRGCGRGRGRSHCAAGRNTTAPRG